MRRLRTLTEAECYVRCYGSSVPSVTLVKLEPRRPRYSMPVSGERLRQRLEERIDARVDDELDAA